MPEFNKFPFEIVLRMCKSSDLYAKEIDLFFSIVAWSQANDSDNANTSALFQEVRYPLISKLNLISKVRPTGLANQELYISALEFHHFPSLYTGPVEQTTKRRYRELTFTNRTPGTTQITEPPDGEGVVITKCSGGYWDSLCVAPIHNIEKYPLLFKFVLKQCSFDLHQGIEVGVRTCSSDDITPPHTDGIDMVGINVGEELDGKVAVDGRHIVISLGGKFKLVLKTHNEVNFCVHMYSHGSVQIWEI